MDDAKTTFVILAEMHRRSLETRRALGARSAGSVRRWVRVIVMLGALGCRTREDAALKVAREGALAAGDACAGADAAQAAEACRESICRARCTSFADSVHLVETCKTQCMGRGTCSSDLDCDPGLTCTVIAPRLRRCESRADAHFD